MDVEVLFIVPFERDKRSLELVFGKDREKFSIASRDSELRGVHCKYLIISPPPYHMSVTDVDVWLELVNYAMTRLVRDGEIIRL